jgi:hypothetical protein
MDSVELLSRTTKPQYRRHRSTAWLVPLVVLVAAILGSWFAVRKFTCLPSVPHDGENGTASARSVGSDAATAASTAEPSGMGQSTTPSTVQLAAEGRGGKAKLPDFRQMPLRLGSWEGEYHSMDEKLLARVGADACINATYRNSENKAISAHLAAFSNWNTGMYHNPMIVYRAAGWKFSSQSYESVQVNNGVPFRVSLSTWQKKQNWVLVLYWYQLGDRILFQRSDLGNLDLVSHDKAPHPPLVKVLLQIDDFGTEAGKNVMKELAGEIRTWLDGAHKHP